VSLNITTIARYLNNAKDNFYFLFRLTPQLCAAIVHSSWQGQSRNKRFNVSPPRILPLPGDCRRRALIFPGKGKDMDISESIEKAQQNMAGFTEEQIAELESHGWIRGVDCGYRSHQGFVHDAAVNLDSHYSVTPAKSGKFALSKITRGLCEWTEYVPFAGASVRVD
jgi:hypothetical protein